MKVLITGGAGYVGSTVASALEDQSIEVVLLDDMSTGRPEFVRGRPLYQGDIADKEMIDQIFDAHRDIYATLHCAAKISVADGISRPLHCYRENVSKTLDLLEGVERNGCDRVVFSSSASVYAPTEDGRVDEDSPMGASSPYPRSKQMMEFVLQDWARSGGARVISLRYFNPIGADPEMRTGLQDLQSTHVLSKVMEAYGRNEPFTLTGVSWPTRDGSGIRDFIHVWDVAQAHVAALRRFDDVVPAKAEERYEAINIGSGDGVTIRELVNAFEVVVDQGIEVVEASSRAGDIMGCYPDIAKARDLLGWRPHFTLDEAMRHAVAWRDRWLETQRNTG
ncbi:UDP-glucose 4-epimerase GalE [Streptomyces sp. NPDC002659]|uniref:UDP-glucose 4-epimerase GalE n=1 Tax=Streptomyces sp. NPDC002659 TaxID=3364656 RepID=UPI00367602E5